MVLMAYIGLVEGTKEPEEISVILKCRFLIGGIYLTIHYEGIAKYYIPGLQCGVVSR